MIVRLSGKLVEKTKNSLIINVQGLFYEVLVPVSILQRVDSHMDSEGNINLITYHYFQISPSSGLPVLIGFLNEIERDFFQQFITVSGIGPRAAVKALNQPISEISKAIDEGDYKFLKTLPGIGLQKSREIVAKLQGKVSRFGLIQDQENPSVKEKPISDWQKEALDVLLQLQYKKQEALNMIQKAVERAPSIRTAEELLNEIYQQKIKG